MAEPIDGQKVANQITARLSLRKPQRESLHILANLLGQSWRLHRKIAEERHKNTELNQQLHVLEQTLKG